MNSIYDIIGIPFGYLMSFIYHVCGNYALTLVLFTVIVRMLLFPITYKNAVAGKRTALIKHKLDAARDEHKGDPAAIQRAQTVVYDEEGIHPMGSCLPSFLQMFLLLGVINVIYKPLTHILHISKDVRAVASDITAKILGGTGASELTVLKQFRSDPDAFSGLSDNFSGSVSDFIDGFTLFGVNLSEIPMKMTDFSVPANVLLWSFPLIYAVITIIAQLYSLKKQNRKLSVFTFLMPLFTFLVGVQLPVGVSFYWICSFVVTTIISIGLNKYLSESRVKAIHNKMKSSYVAKPHVAGNFANELMGEFNSGLVELMGQKRSQPADESHGNKECDKEQNGGE